MASKFLNGGRAIVMFGGVLLGAQKFLKELDGSFGMAIRPSFGMASRVKTCI